MNPSRNLLVLTLLISFAMNFGCSYTPFQGSTKTAPEKFKAQIKKVDCDNRDRLESVRSLFADLGVNPDDIVVEDFEKVKNITVTVPGKSDETIVVGAHYDKTTLGCGAIDNWTGIVIVANLYASFKDKNNQKTFRFVAFGDEEKGLVGSKAMARAIPKARLEKHCAMVNFDSFGFDDLWALQKTSDASLINFAKNLAGRRNVSFPVKNFKGASSDSKSFQVAGIPSITMSGLGDNWKDYLHQDSDQVSQIKMDKVYENFLFAEEYLTELDAESCGAFR